MENNNLLDDVAVSYQKMIFFHNIYDSYCVKKNTILNSPSSKKEKESIIRECNYYLEEYNNSIDDYEDALNNFGLKNS